MRKRKRGVAELQRRVLPLRLNAVSSHRLKTAAGLLGLSEAAFAKLAMHRACEEIFVLLKMIVNDAAEDYVSRTLGLRSVATDNRDGEAINAQMAGIKTRLAQICPDLAEARRIVSRRKYRRDEGPLHYRGDAHDRSMARQIFEPLNPEMLEDAIRALHDDMAVEFLSRVEEHKNRWLCLADLRRQVVAAIYDPFDADMVALAAAQAGALSALVRRITKAGQITKAIISATEGNELISQNICRTLSDAEMPLSEKMVSLRRQADRLVARAESIREQRDRADARVKDLQGSTAWSDVQALQQLISSRSDDKQPSILGYTGFSKIT